MSDILLGKSDIDVLLRAKYANRHGLIAGATGTGKSVTLMRLAEGFSQMGVPVFLADVKGDLAGLCEAGGGNAKIDARVAELKVDWKAQANPVVFWDIFGQLGHPVRSTISEMGPNLLGRLLELNDTQEGVLEVVFKLADDEGLLLIDIKDLRALLTFAAENAKSISQRYGLISSTSIAAIQRALLGLEQAGGEQFFGEPALDLADFLRQDMSGRGVVNILAADKLILKPKLYSTFLLWMLSELFERLPEVGDLDQPKLVFFFDEAHLLFKDAPAALVERIELVVRLVRSKGVGVYFVTQNPLDIPDSVLAQLGNRVQHALRAYTPRDQKAVKAAAETFPPNPKIKKVADVITQLGVGEALVTTLQDGGVPLPVERVLIVPPGCRVGAITDAERAAIRARSPVGGKYDTAVDRESAYEKLSARASDESGAAEEADTSTKKKADKSADDGNGWGDMIKGALFGTGRRQGMIEATAKSAMRTVGNQLGRQILRGVLGSIMGGKR
ncbi:MAG TPA: helicase HerA-like domain-containing protein [Tahibacter sp.]|nr:helicase HerA-like domain-containing protein [Tahibacter sp.]